MNIHSLSHDEAAYLLFAIKKTLRDRQGLTPEMEQFYDSMYRALHSKLQRFSGEGTRDPTPPERYSFSKVRPNWLDVSLGEGTGDQSADS